MEGETEKGNQSLSTPPSPRQEQKARTVLRDPCGHPLPKQLFILFPVNRHKVVCVPNKKGLVRRSVEDRY